MRTSTLWRRGILPLWAVFVLVAIVAAPASVARAQIAIPAAALEDESEVARLLEEGHRLEQDRRWGEAVSHYENALRSHPGRRDLEERIGLARMHFDVARRYADTSYRATVGALSERESLDLYSDVLLKIQTHFVHEPNWQSLVRRGTTGVEVAFSEPAFTDRYLAGMSGERVDAFRAELRRTVDWHAVRNRQEARDAVALAGRIGSRHLGLPPSAVILEYVCSATGGLDEYSAFLTPAQLDDVFSQIEGNFVGLGIELKGVDGSLLIVHVIAGSPAEKAGLHAGDRIVEVDGRPTAELSTDKAADMLKGAEGSTVEVGAVSPGMAPRRVRVRRERVEVPSVEDVKIVDRGAGIAYLRITSFQKTTVRDLDAALWKLHGEGMRSLIVDVRGNPGGLLTASVEAADRFLEGGAIVMTRGRSPREDFDYMAHAQGTWRVPLVVLIDRDSASASEIFAGAIADHRRGMVVGERSFGKGSVQGIFPLGIGKAGVRLTTAKFYTPTGRAISRQGVTPNVAVQAAAKPVAETGKHVPAGGADDAILSAGIEAARQQVAQR
jgi:carboxyl-terminal processing protease